MKTIRIENSGHEPHIINVPDGAKVIIEDGLTMVEPEKYIPKTGDCVKISCKSNNCYSYIGFVNEIKEFYAECDNIEDGRFYKAGCFYFTDHVFTQITPEELQSEFNKLGYEYDFCQHKARKLRLKPEYGEKYYSVLSDCEIDSDRWHNDGTDNSRYKIGNCYRTAEEAEPRRQHYLSFKD